eukprot:jgi/Ulvmu1/3838/UM018_0050.1
MLRHQCLCAADRAEDSDAPAVVAGEEEPGPVRAKAQLERCSIQHGGVGVGTYGRSLAALMLCMLRCNSCAVTARGAGTRAMLLCCDMDGGVSCGVVAASGTLRAYGCKMVGQNTHLYVSEGGGVGRYRVDSGVREGEHASRVPSMAISCPLGSTTVTGGSVKGFLIGIKGSGPGHSAGMRAAGGECEDAAARAAQPPCPPGRHSAQTAVALCEARGGGGGGGGVHGCRCEGNEEDVAGSATGRLRVLGCSFVHSHAADPLALQDVPVCLKAGAPIAAGGVAVGAPVEVSKCGFTRMRARMRAAVQLNAASCAVRHCSFESCEDAIVVHANRELSVSLCEFDRCARAICVGLRTTLTVEDWDSRGAGECVGALGGGGVVTATRLVANGRKREVRVLLHGGVHTAVKLEVCDFIRLSAGVWLGGAGVDAELLDCWMSEGSVGLALNEAVVACVRESQMHACSVAVEVGAWLREKGDAGDPCWACRVACYGPGAVDTGVPGMCEPGDSALAAWCCHEGGLARLAMAGVALHDCRVGVDVTMHGRLEVERLHLQACGESVALSQPGGQLHASFRSCQGCTLTAFTHAPTVMRLAPGHVLEPLELLPGFAEAEARSSWATQQSKGEGAREE